jgi:radical SAM superfamily enzyme YgiQ (UPF0313 family)/predicted nucleic-acid-binding Zn-ribbon protein
MKYNIYLLAQETDHPPLALGYLKAYVEKYLGKRQNISIITLKDLKSSLDIENYKYGKPDLLGFSCYKDPEFFIDLGKKLKKNMPDIKIVLGGPTINGCFYNKLNFGDIDYIVYGEGEKTFLELLNHLIYKKIEVSSIDGLIYKKGDKHIVNKPRKEIENINEIPSPYLTNIFDYNKYKEFYLEASRGCIYKCSYCILSNKKYREFSLERVKKEIEYIISKRRDLHRIDFCDNDIFINLKRAKSFFDFIKKTNIKACFDFNTDFLKINDFTVPLISDPRISLGIGIQTLTPAALKQAKRFHKTNIIKKHIDKYIIPLSNSLHSLVVSFIYGLPEDNFKKFQNNIDLALKLGVKAEFFRLIVWKNTGFDYDSNKYKIAYSFNYPYHVLSSNTYSKKDIEKTENLIKELSLLMELYKKDKYFHYLLSIYASAINEKNPYLKAYLNFKSYLEKNEEAKEIIEKLIKIDKSSYHDENAIELRLYFYTKIIKFISEKIGKNKDRDLDNKLINFFIKTKVRLHIKRHFDMILKIVNEKFVNIYSPDCINLKWVDYYIKKSENAVNILDIFSDKDHIEMKFKSLEIDNTAINDMIEKYKVLIFWDVFDWFKNETKNILLQKNKGKTIYMIGNLNSDDLNIANASFKETKIFNLSKDIKIYRLKN